jgi:hypothetical protein
VNLLLKCVSTTATYYYFNNHNYTSSPHQTYPNNNANFSAAQNNFNNQEIRRESPSPPSEKMGIIDDESLEMFRQMVEIKKLLGQNQWSSVGLPTSRERR